MFNKNKFVSLDAYRLISDESSESKKKSFADLSLFQQILLRTLVGTVGVSGAGLASWNKDFSKAIAQSVPAASSETITPPPNLEKTLDKGEVTELQMEVISPADPNNSQIFDIATFLEEHSTLSPDEIAAAQRSEHKIQNRITVLNKSQPQMERVPELNAQATDKESPNAVESDRFYSAHCSEPGDLASTINMTQKQIPDATAGTFVYEVTNPTQLGSVTCMELTAVNAKRTFEFLARVTTPGRVMYKAIFYKEDNTVFTTAQAPQDNTSEWVRFNLQLPSYNGKLKAYVYAESQEGKPVFQLDDISLIFEMREVFIPAVSNETPPPAPALESGYTGEFSPTSDVIAEIKKIAREKMLPTDIFKTQNVLHEGKLYPWISWPMNPGVVQYYSKTTGEPTVRFDITSNQGRDTYKEKHLVLLAAGTTTIPAGLEVVGTLTGAGGTVEAIVTVVAAPEVVGILALLAILGYLLIPDETTIIEPGEIVSTPSGIIDGNLHFNGTETKDSFYQKPQLWLYRSENISAKNAHDSAFVAHLDTGTDGTTTTGITFSTKQFSDEVALSPNSVSGSFVQKEGWRFPLTKNFLNSDYKYAAGTDEGVTIHAWLNETIKPATQVYAALYSELTPVQAEKVVWLGTNTTSNRQIAMTTEEIPGITIPFGPQRFIALKVLLQQWLIQDFNMPNQEPTAQVKEATIKEMQGYMEDIDKNTGETTQLSPPPPIEPRREKGGDNTCYENVAAQKADLIKGFKMMPELLSSPKLMAAFEKAILAGEYEVTYDLPYAIRKDERGKRKPQAFLLAYLNEEVEVDSEWLGVPTLNRIWTDYVCHRDGKNGQARFDILGGSWMIDVNIPSLAPNPEAYFRYYCWTTVRSDDITGNCQSDNFVK